MPTQPILEPFLVVPCIVVRCGGGCGEPFWKGDPPHYETVEAAITDLATDGWVFIARRLALCPTCAVQADCKLTGHQWCDWVDDNVEGLSCKQRTCTHCGEQEYDPPLGELQVLVQLRELDWDGGDEMR